MFLFSHPAKRSGYFMFDIKNPTFCPQCVFVWISEQMEIISTHLNEWLL